MNFITMKILQQHQQYLVYKFENVKIYEALQYTFQYTVDSSDVDQKVFNTVKLMQIHLH